MRKECRSRGGGSSFQSFEILFINCQSWVFRIVSFGAFLGLVAFGGIICAISSTVTGGFCLTLLVGLVGLVMFFIVIGLLVKRPMTLTPRTLGTPMPFLAIRKSFSSYTIRRSLLESLTKSGSQRLTTFWIVGGPGLWGSRSLV